MNYRETAIATYGTKCEICTYGIVEVHHIGYQEHQETEDYIRYLFKNGNDISVELAKAYALGFLKWDGNQLSKDDRSTNLSCLCSNCHYLIHLMNVGLRLLKAIPERKIFRGLM